MAPTQTKKSPFTKSNDFLFDPAIIPDHLQQVLPPGHFVRPLSRSDNQLRHNTSFLKTLEVLTVVGDIEPVKFEERFQYLQKHNDQYFTIVIEDMNAPTSSPNQDVLELVPPGRGKIVAAGTVLIERKFIRGLGLVGHIEDIA
ncbi:Glucosamine-phosphate N-acetyltransferase-like protein, partial [Lunasporangiospora selenospora]